MNQSKLTDLILSALAEDIGDGDHSTLSCIQPHVMGKASLLVKQQAIIAGLEVAQKIIQLVEPTAQIHFFKRDGDYVMPGEIAFEITASVHTILKCERLVLNTMQRMSGIATLTRKYVDAISGFHTQLLDTRKTTPNFRLLEKEAVRIGGAVNHRFGLYDMIMLKDNHIDYCGSIEKAILLAQQYVLQHKPGMKIEVETRNLEDVKKVMETGCVDRIMLDNFTPNMISEALRMIDHRFETEASGGIHFNNIKEYAATGVDFISSGAIIHQATSIDLSLKAVIV